MHNKNVSTSYVGALTLIVSLFQSNITQAQDTPLEITNLQTISADNPQLALTKTDTKPTIDGFLDEPLWQTTAGIENLTQVEPVEGAKPSQRTKIHITYDNDFIYFGIRCFDS